MKSILIFLILLPILVNSTFAQSEPVKLSKAGICHVPGSSYYSKTMNFKPYKTLDDCIKSGGRMPKK